ncbi:MAG: hypothetical protein JW731_14465 [Bacteroidales bacterium]|nr:hypothetical protein [Bacteroidales bacterium]
MVNNERLSLIIFVGILVVLFTFACKKDEQDDGWSYCTDCNAENWAGTYTGTCSVYDAINNLNYSDQQVTIVVAQTGNDVLSVQVTVPVIFTISVSGPVQSSYSLSLSSNEKSFLGTLYKKETQLKLTGSAKTFYDKAGKIELLKSVNFETFK